MYNFWHPLRPRELSVLIKLKFVLIIEVSVGRGFSCCHSGDDHPNTQCQVSSDIYEEIGANAYASRIIHKL